MKLILWKQDDVLPGGAAPVVVVGESHGGFIYLGKPTRGITRVWMDDGSFAVAVPIGATSFVTWISPTLG